MGYGYGVKGLGFRALGFMVMVRVRANADAVANVVLCGCLPFVVCRLA